MIFNKPYGVLSTFTDRGGRPTLKDFVPVEGIYAAGRLDIDSEGLLLLTNDGELIHRLTDPRYHHPKTYLVQIEGEVTETALERLRQGIDLGKYTSRVAQVKRVVEPELPPRPKPITPHGPVSWLKIILFEGKKREIRHLTAAVGLPTLRLVRVAIGSIELAGLLPGEWRVLTKQEIRQVKTLIYSL